MVVIPCPLSTSLKTSCYRMYSECESPSTKAPYGKASHTLWSGKYILVCPSSPHFICKSNCQLHVIKLQSLQHTYTAQISRVWTPPIFSAHCRSHRSHQTTGTDVECHWTNCSANVVACNKSAFWVRCWTTVNYSEDIMIECLKLIADSPFLN